MAQTHAQQVEAGDGQVVEQLVFVLRPSGQHLEAL